MAAIKNKVLPAAMEPKASKASTPSKAGETPVNVKPHVSYEDVAAKALTQLDALMRGGVEAILFITSAFLVNYLNTQSGGKGTKLAVIKAEFALMLQKKGLGATQTSKYLDYSMTLAQRMFKECQFGMEMAALIAATTPDAAHDAVKAYVSRHVTGKKTEHGFKLSEALVKLNVLAIWLGKDADPSKPEELVKPEDAAATAKKEADARKSLAAKIGKDPAVLEQVNAERLAETVAKVITFDVLVSKHVLTITTADKLREELKAIEKAYHDRIAALEQEMGQPKPARETKRSSLKRVAKQEQKAA